MIVKAKLRIVTPHLLKDGRSTEELWDLLAEEGRLPAITNREAYMGLSPNGVFFLDNLTKTRDGLECQIFFYPKHFDGDSHRQRIEWFKENFFCGQELKVRGQGDRGYNFRLLDVGVTFILEDIEEIKVPAPE